MTPTTAVQLIRKYRPDSSIRQMGKWLTHSCIINRVHPHHAHDDANGSAGINVETGAYHCFVWSDRSISFKDLCRLLGGDYEFMPQGSEVPEDSDLRAEVERRLHADERTPGPYNLGAYDPDPPEYMHSGRHLSWEVLRRAGIMYDQITDRVLIPIWQASIDGDRRLVGLQRRVIPGSSSERRYPKYDNSNDMRKSEVLYAMEPLDLHRPLLVVESVMSVLRAWDYGFRNCVAAMGSHLSRSQLDFIRMFDDVVLWFDGDESGIRGTADAIRKLVGVNLLIVCPKDSRDIDDLPKKASMRLMASAVTPVEWLTGHSDTDVRG